MKKLVLALSTFALVFAFSACGGPEADGKKMGKKNCECRKIQDEGYIGNHWNEEKRKEFRECWDELEKMKQEYEQKYENDKEAYIQFYKAWDETFHECAK